MQNDPLFWVSFSVDSPFSSFSVLWTSLTPPSIEPERPHLVPLAVPSPVMMWAQPSRQVMLWAHIPGGMGPILNGSTALEISVSPGKNSSVLPFRQAALCKGLLSDRVRGMSWARIAAAPAQLQCWVSVPLPPDLELWASVQTSGMFWAVTTLALCIHPHMPISILSLSQVIHRRDNFPFPCLHGCIF